MSTPQTINGLMRHLRNDCNINIKGSYQKKQLESYGYYHGYKGYRFVRNSSNQMPYSDFSEVVAVIEYDSSLKSILYPELMFIETAIKNIVCNESVQGLKTGTFEHFYNRGEDVPIWVVFEIMYLSDLASFFECLNKAMREKLLEKLELYDLVIDTNSNLLSSILYTLKALRNAVAHNNIIFDTRFKDRNISKVLKKWIEKETKLQNITLYSLIDYIIIICCILKRIDFNGTRALNLLKKYNEENLRLKNSVTPNIYSQIIQQKVDAKISELEVYLKS